MSAERGARAERDAGAERGSADSLSAAEAQAPREAPEASAPELRIAGLVHRAGAFRLEVDLECRRWPLVLLGPSGAGKTMLLRILAGLETPEAGTVEFAGETWFSAREKLWRPAHRRSIGYCTQDPLLFPHLSVLDNVVWPLGNLTPRPSRAERRARAVAELERWGAGALAASPVAALSGGEQGRVALARAFVRRPGLLLLDEPLAALDPPSREEISARVRRELLASPRADSSGASARAAKPADLPPPAIWVTHDRNEALLLGHTVAVLLNGRIAQVGTPEEIFRRPSNPEVAGFVGVGSVLHGLVQARESGVMRIHCGPIVLRAVGNLPPGTPVVATIRSEEVELLSPEAGARGGLASGSSAAGDPISAGGPQSSGGRLAGGAAGAHTSARNELPATVVSIRPLGLAFLIELDAGVPLAAAVTRPALEELALAPGVAVRARIKALAVQVRSEGWGGSASS